MAINNAQILISLADSIYIEQTRLLNRSLKKLERLGLNRTESAKKGFAWLTVLVELLMEKGFELNY